jgi:hypothetical protein
MAKTKVDVAELVDVRTYHETFEVALGGVMEAIRDLLEVYSVAGWSEPPNRWYRTEKELAEYGMSDLEAELLQGVGRRH